MLKENIRAYRRSKGLSQEALAVRLNVVRQTISKWEQGLSVPDSEMLLTLSEALDTPVSALLGETVTPEIPDGLTGISEKLEAISTQMARKKKQRRWVMQGLLITICAATILVFAALVVLDSPYLAWDYHDPETAVVGVAFHAIEWIFIRAVPVVLAAGLTGIWLVRKFL